MARSLKETQDYYIELEQILLDCCDAMECNDISPLLKDTRDRVIFAKGYLHEYVFLKNFLLYLVTGSREEIPF